MKKEWKFELNLGGRSVTVFSIGFFSSETINCILQGRYVWALIFAALVAWDIRVLRKESK
ncbi:MAG TPA: hypothetical protein VK190_04975 [Pseudoneobacillus sp.]|nr:hypothetical protein [Pseudoneobacillus sp.]